MLACIEQISKPVNQCELCQLMLGLLASSQVTVCVCVSLRTKTDTQCVSNIILIFPLS